MKREFKKVTAQPEPNTKASFDGIIDKARVRKKLHLKRNLALGGISIMIMVSVISIVFLKDEVDDVSSGAHSDVEPEKVVKESSAIRPKEWKTKMIAVGPDQEIQDGGKLIEIPAGTISADADSVKILYRFSNDPVDMISSSIPMNYDSAGIAHILLSDGMIEIEVDHKGKKLSWNPDNPILVHFPIKDSQRTYNTYELDGTWKYIETEPVRVPDSYHPGNDHEDFLDEEVDLVNLKAELNRLERIVLSPPLKKSEKMITFSVEYSDIDFPELAGFKEVEFISKDDKVKTGEWDEVSITKKRGKSEYILIFSNSVSRLRVDALPVFSGDDYERSFEEFENKRLRLKKEIEDKRVEVEMAELEKEREDQRRRKLLSSRAISGYRQVKATRILRVTRPGTWNLDCPVPIDIAFPKSISPIFLSREGTVINAEQGYLISDDFNTYVSFDPGKKLRIGGGRNRVILVGSGQSIYSFDRAESVPMEEDGTYRFNMNDLSSTGMENEDLKKLLGLK